MGLLHSNPFLTYVFIGYLYGNVPVEAWYFKTCLNGEFMKKYIMSILLLNIFYLYLFWSRVMLLPVPQRKEKRESSIVVVFKNVTIKIIV